MYDSVVNFQGILSFQPIFIAKNYVIWTRVWRAGHGYKSECL